MDNKELYAEQQRIKKQAQDMREQDRQVADNLKSQNIRLEMLITNYRLGKQWARIMWRVEQVERIKRGWVRLIGLFSWKKLDKPQPKDLTSQNL